jgi:glycosyltransferase involved in cell wall biosynthesis
MLSISILTSSFPRWEGDYAGVFIKDSILDFSEKDVSMSVVCPSSETDSPYQPEEFEIKRFRYMPFRELQRLAYDGGMRDLLSRLSLSTIQLPFFILSFILHAVRDSKDKDIIHAHWLFPAGFVGVLASTIHRKPLVITIRGSDVNLSMRRGLLRAVAKAIMRKSDLIISVSRDLKKKAMRMEAPPHKIAVFTDGVEAHRQVSSNREYRHILFLGRLAPEKRIGDVLEAISILRNRGEEAKLRIAGDGPMESTLTSQCRDLGIEEDVEFLGCIPHDQTTDLISKNGIFILCSSSEGLPDSLISAMSLGKPIVATSIPGISEAVVNGRSGILVQPKSPREIADALSMILREPTFATKAGKIAKIITKRRFDRRDSSHRLLNAYFSLWKQSTCDKTLRF